MNKNPIRIEDRRVYYSTALTPQTIESLCGDELIPAADAPLQEVQTRLANYLGGVKPIWTIQHNRDVFMGWMALIFIVCKLGQKPLPLGRQF